MEREPARHRKGVYALLGLVGFSGGARGSSPSIGASSPGWPRLYGARNKIPLPKTAGNPYAGDKTAHGQICRVYGDLVGYKERLPETEKGTEMTQYEVASLAVQYMGVWVAGAVGFAQCLLIGIGLLYMRRAAILRDRALDELIERTRSNHDENMTVLNKLIERTDANEERRSATLNKLIERTDANEERRTTTFNKLIERTDANEDRRTAVFDKWMERTDANQEQSMIALRELIARTGGARA